MPIRLPFLLLVTLSSLVFLQTGCSSARLVYDNADWLIERWVKRKLDPPEQRLVAWRPQLDATLKQHRGEVLPRTLDFLETLSEAAGAGLTRPRVACLLDVANEIYRLHAALAVDLAVPLLDSVSADQIVRLEKQFLESREDYREKYLPQDLNGRAAERRERYIERVERWTGPLEADQREIVAGMTDTIPDVTEPWLHYRMGRENALMGLLRQGVGPAELRRYLTAWWVELDGRQADLEADMEQMREATMELISALDQGLDPGQRNRLVSRFSDLASGLKPSLPMMASNGASAGAVPGCVNQDYRESRAAGAPWSPAPGSGPG